MEIPYYLDPNVAQSNQFGTFNIFAEVEVPQQTPTSIWGELSSTADTAGDWIWDSIGGVWVSTKEALSGAASGLAEGVKGTFSLLGEGVDWWLTRVAFIAGGLILLIWVLGKSGGFEAVSKGASAYLKAKG